MTSRMKPNTSIDNLVSNALWGMEVKVFLRRRNNDYLTPKTVSIQFATDLEAEQFLKLLLSKRGRTRS